MHDKRRPRPRRAGRKVQLKRIWKAFSLPPRQPISPVEDEIPVEPEIEAAHDPASQVPWRLIRIDLGPPRLRIRRVETLTTRIRIATWRLHKIDLPPVIYPATVPATDPRYNAYIRKRSEVLYPADLNNNLATATDTRLHQGP